MSAALHKLTAQLPAIPCVACPPTACKSVVRQEQEFYAALGDSGILTLGLEERCPSDVERVWQTHLAQTKLSMGAAARPHDIKHSRKKHGHARVSACMPRLCICLGSATQRAL